MNENITTTRKYEKYYHNAKKYEKLEKYEKHKMCGSGWEAGETPATLAAPASPTENRTIPNPGPLPLLLRPCMKSRQIVKDNLSLFSYRWFLNNAPTAHHNITWHLGIGDEHFIGTAMASPPQSEGCVVDPRPLSEPPWHSLGRVFTSTAPARNIVQVLSYRCLPSPK